MNICNYTWNLLSLAFGKETNILPGKNYDDIPYIKGDFSELTLRPEANFSFGGFGFIEQLFFNIAKFSSSTKKRYDIAIIEGLRSYNIAAIKVPISNIPTLRLYFKEW